MSFPPRILESKGAGTLGTPHSARVRPGPAEEFRMFPLFPKILPARHALAFGAFLLGGSSVAFGQVLISEIRIDHPGAAAGLTDREEFVELVGPPGTSLDNLSYVVVGDTLPEGGNSGMIEKVLHLHDQVIGPSGRFVMAQHNFTPDNEDYTLTIDFEDGGTVTHLLVANLAGASVGTEIDTQHDGFVDLEPWGQVLDALAIVDPDDSTYPYGPTVSPHGLDGVCVAGTACNEIVIVAADPGHFYRCAATGRWHEGSFSPTSPGEMDSPGAANICPQLFAHGFEQ
jgi:hypothetical protein